MLESRYNSAIGQLKGPVGCLMRDQRQTEDQGSLQHRPAKSASARPRHYDERDNKDRQVRTKQPEKPALHPEPQNEDKEHCQHWIAQRRDEHHLEISAYVLA